MPKLRIKIILLPVALLWLVSCTHAPKYRKPSPDNSPPPDSQREKVVQVAQSYLGTPYRSGGETRQGMDCSGLVMTVYKTVGLKLPRTARDQSLRGEKITKSQMKPGDLVCFSNGRSAAVSHVGIYVGKDRFIHASTSARRVRIDSFENSYFRTHFRMARRLL